MNPKSDKVIISSASKPKAKIADDEANSSLSLKQGKIAIDKSIEDEVRPKKRKKSKKKSKKSSRKDNAIDTSADDENETDRDQNEEKSIHKGKKRQAADSIEDNFPLVNEKHPRKKQKRRKKAKSGKANVDTSPKIEDSDLLNTPNALEGAMVENQMVLIDKSEGLVYSATERTTDGARKKIGTFSSGEIVLNFQVEEDAVKFPFATDPDDHCESPLQAYRDISLFLNLCKQGDPLIYDPYYCNGTVVQHLSSLGFSNVHNRKEDCYEVWKTAERYPKFDVFVTNPPFSADHICKLMQHVTSAAFGERPWMLLMPQWVHKKDYYIEATKNIQPFFLVPHKRYVYLPPSSFRAAKKSDVHKKSSPFVSMWFIWGGNSLQNAQWLSKARSIKGCDVARSKSALRDLRRKKK